MTLQMVSQSYLREIFDYLPDGQLRWRERPASHFRREQDAKTWNKQFSGTFAGSSRRKGHFAARVDGTKYALHRLVWAWHHGSCPQQVDHINRDRTDNRIENLRAATNRQNAFNKERRTDRGLPRGVATLRSGRFMARIRVNGACTYLGSFDTEQQAHEAYCVAARIHHGEFASFD